MRLRSVGLRIFSKLFEFGELVTLSFLAFCVGFNFLEFLVPR